VTAQKRKDLRLLAEIARLDQEEHRQRIWASKQNFSEGGARAEEERQFLWEEKRYNLERRYLRLGREGPGPQSDNSRLDCGLYAPKPSRTLPVGSTETGLRDFENLQIE
jgi:hypothetical protein